MRVTTIGGGLVFSVILLLPTASVTRSADVTCGWCNEIETNEGWIHGFFDESGDQCLQGAPDVGIGNTYCARCGGTSTCHTKWWQSEGRCHLACGGTASIDLHGIEDALARLAAGDPEPMVTQLQAAFAASSLTYSAAGGRIDVFAACDPVTPLVTYPVKAEWRDILNDALTEAS